LLVAGCWLLVAGCWLPVAGCWLPVAGCWLLVAGSLGAPLLGGAGGGFFTTHDPVRRAEGRGQRAKGGY